MKLFYIIIGTLINSYFFAQAQEVLSLEKIGRSLGFPPEQLVIEDYLDKEQSAYIDKTVGESQEGTSQNYLFAV